MPICMNPEKRYWLALDSDMKIPKADRPEFQFRHQTMSELDIWYDLGREWDRNAGLKKPCPKEIDRLYDAMINGFKKILFGWRNMTDPSTGKAMKFDREKLKGILHVTEIFDLFMMIPQQSVMEVTDAKKSKSRSASGKKKSAKRARGK